MMRWLLLATISLTTAGCFSAGKRTTAYLPAKEATELLTELEQRELNWNTLGLRMEASAEAMGQSGSFTLNVRMARDSVIWMSISPALGVEAVRVLMTPDSVQVLSKVPGSRWVFQGNYEVLDQAIEAPVSFHLMQDLLLGNPLMMDQSQDVFVSKIQGDAYVLMAKYDRRIRKLVGTDDRGLAPDDSLRIVAKDKKAERIIGKADESEELIVKRYWLDGETSDPIKDVVNDLFNGRTVQVTRSEFEDTELGRLPSLVRMTAQGTEGTFDATFETKRRRAGRAYDFPFSIPEGFEKRTNL